MSSLEDLGTKGARKYGAKISGMVSSYRAAEGRAKDGYGKTPFGPTRKSAYNAAWTYMPDNYATIVKPGLESKWREKWIAKPPIYLDWGGENARVAPFEAKSPV